MKNKYFLSFSLTAFFLLTIFSVRAEGKGDIFQLARKGTVKEVQALMKQSPEIINKKNENGYTPLILACYSGNNAVAKFLIGHVKDINGSSANGSALMAATVKGNVALVEYLLATGANPNIGDANGTTALHYAIMFKNTAIALLLIKSNAKADFKDNRGNTALDYAKLNEKENKEIIDLLIKK